MRVVEEGEELMMKGRVARHYEFDESTCNEFIFTDIWDESEHEFG